MGSGRTMGVMMAIRRESDFGIFRTSLLLLMVPSTHQFYFVSTISPLPNTFFFLLIEDRHSFTYIS